MTSKMPRPHLSILLAIHIIFLPVTWLPSSDFGSLFLPTVKIQKVPGEGKSGNNGRGTNRQIVLLASDAFGTAIKSICRPLNSLFLHRLLDCPRVRVREFLPEFRVASSEMQIQGREVYDFWRMQRRTHDLTNPYSNSTDNSTAGRCPLNRTLCLRLRFIFIELRTGEKRE